MDNFIVMYMTIGYELHLQKRMVSFRNKYRGKIYNRYYYLHIIH